ncbi:YbfB/YjiJ family MFS transporter [Noviherbaspirillum galbum]|uniref:YbfB/YjiJ family MFS transporter n=1 Tax=Noviherbaspirillum galbum TaxID=2709383 RepID=A0A6B3SNN0_9BURK|nr:YbfB/YjiJ family MFS transporter [Noviherbaspirillum galbum]NEX62414.1 YbfB/YjiJ family MFS transporter [Noviherbaspirillum galbum]
MLRDHEQRGDRERQRRQVIFSGICALILTVGLARFAYTPMLPIMQREAGLSYLAGGWLATFNYMGYMAGALLAATTGEPRQKFQLYRAGLLIALASTAAMGMTENVALWAALRFVSGFSSIAGLLLASGLILNWLIRNGHQSELGMHFTGVGLGILISGVAVGTMAGSLSWDKQWLALGALGLAFFFPAWRWLPAPQPVQGGGAAKAGPPPLSRRWLGLLITAYFCAGFGFVIGATFIVAVVEKLPALAGKGAWVWVIVGAAGVPSSFFWDWVARRAGEIPALIMAFAVQAVSLIIPATTQSGFLNMTSAVLYGMTAVGIVSLTLSLIGRAYPGNPAKAMAGLTLSYGVAQITAPAMAGYIAAATGSYRGALLVATAVMIVGMALLHLLRRQAKQAISPVQA